MWCKQCQQDVPGVADGDGATVCARCSAVLRLPALARAAVEREVGGPCAIGDGPAAVDDWRLDDEISTAERLLRTFRNDGETIASPVATSRNLLEPRGACQRLDELLPDGDAGETEPRGGLIAWAFLLAGTAALVCGGVLAGWSIVAGRAALWNLGLPILLGGQAGVLVGILLHIERMWRNSRLAARRLAEVDHQLSDLRQTTTLLGNTYGGSSSTFFAHLAEGASPQLLLADLKGQLDLLAMKVSRSG